MSQALKPEFFGTLPTIAREEEAKQKGVSGEEQAIFALSQQNGWRILKEFSEDLLKDLDNVTELGMKQGLALEEIGKNAVVANLAKGVIKRIIQKVEDAREAVDGQQ